MAASCHQMRAVDELAQQNKTNQTNHKMCILSILGVVDLEPRHLQLRPVEGTREDRLA